MSATPEQIADVMNGDNSLRQSEAAIDELLKVFLSKAEPVTRKLADEVYERFLYLVQDYLRDNAAWNLSLEIDRCRRVEAENRTLSETVRAQAERVRVLEGALRGLTDAYCALLLMKGEDPSRFKEPGSPYAKADAALSGAP